MCKETKGTWDLASYQPGDMINRLMLDPSAADSLIRFRLAVSQEASSVHHQRCNRESSVGFGVCGAISLSMSHSLWHAQLWRRSRKPAC